MRDRTKTTADWWRYTSSAARIEQIRAAGEPVTLADLAQPPMPPENNAAAYLLAAEGELETLVEELEAPYDIERRLYPDSERSLNEVGLGMWPAGFRLGLLEKGFDAHPQVIPALEQAAGAAGYDFGYDCSAPPTRFLAAFGEQFPVARNAVRVLAGWAVFRAASGEPDAGLRVCVTILRLTARLNQEPLLLAELLRIGLRQDVLACANRILQRRPTSAAARGELRAAVAEIDSWRLLRHAILTDRAYVLSAFREAGPDSPSFERDLEATLAAFDATLALCQSERHDPTAAAALVAASANFGPIAKNESPAGVATRDCVLIEIARRRCFLAMLAIYDRLDESDDENPTFESLGLDDATGVDPRTGERIKILKEPLGWRIYAGDLQEGFGFGPTGIH